MKKVKLILLPEGKKILALPGRKVKEILEEEKKSIPFPCGGRGICGKCKIRIKGEFSPLSEEERKILSPEERKEGIRLACRVKVKGEGRIEILPQEAVLSRILIGGRGRRIKLEPELKKIKLELEPPELGEGKSDFSRLEEELKKGGIFSPSLPLPLLKKLPQLLRKNDFKVNCILLGKEILEIEGGREKGKIFGAAFDIGTTTVVGSLVNLEKGREEAVEASLNPQRLYGEDVISRVSFVQSNPGGLKILQERIVGEVNSLLGKLTKRTGIRKEEIYEMVVVGNTVMEHLFVGVNPLWLSLYPYVPVFKGPLRLKAREVGIKIHPQGIIYLFPGLGSFVGGDTVAVILSTSLLRKRDGKVRLGIDIGTNGELVLVRNGKAFCASCAAGPAFEGGRISQGMRAEKGAVEKFWFSQGRVRVKVIEGGPPRGICGSGFIKAVAEMLEERILTPGGKIEPKNSKWLSRMVRKNEDVGFCLLKENELGKHPPLILTQRDIRELQLAKAAICSGIKILLSRMGIKEEEVEEVYLAGAFGNWLDPEDARRISLIPSFPQAKIKFVGNAAHRGALLALLSWRAKKEAEKISRKVEYVEIAASPDFQERLTQCIPFEERK